MDIGKLSLEYDGSIVAMGQVVGNIAPDTLTPKEVKSFNEELVRRWNAFEDTSPEQQFCNDMGEVYMDEQSRLFD